MSSTAVHFTQRPLGRRSLLSAFLFLLFCSTSVLTQQTAPRSSATPKYDTQSETKDKGLLDEVNIIDFGSRKDFVQLILKDGSETVVVEVCPKPFQEEMGITFTKGDQISFTGSRVKQEQSEVILAREIVKGTDTFTFRDAKGTPVWDPRTGK
ncbi:MAG TPA: hypothetical protein VL126_04605 [Bacteroidota bacterium]|nr:hypothetical protein [Bacteroidota bacterium]